MKLSISLPDSTAREIKTIAKKTDRSVSWWIQRAWDAARTRLLRDDEVQLAYKRAMKRLGSLHGILKEEFPDLDSVTLAHQAFQIKK